MFKAIFRESVNLLKCTKAIPTVNRFHIKDLFLHIYIRVVYIARKNLIKNFAFIRWMYKGGSRAWRPLLQFCCKSPTTAYVLPFTVEFYQNVCFMIPFLSNLIYFCPIYSNLNFFFSIFVHFQIFVSISFVLFHLFYSKWTIIVLGFSEKRRGNVEALLKATVRFSGPWLLFGKNLTWIWGRKIHRKLV